MFDFSDKIVLVTGGSGEIGSALVRAYISTGANVYFSYSTSKEKAVFLCNDLKIDPTSYCQVRSENKEEIIQFVKYIGNKHGKIDILVNNAGVVTNSFFFPKEEDFWDKTIAINLTGVRNYCVEAFPYLKKSLRGAIVNISSMSADRPSLGMSAYVSSKAAIEGLSKVLALEYALYGIRVNTVAPGLIDTKVASNFPETIKKNIIKRTPLKRLGKVEDVVNAVLFLSDSNLSAFITGSQLYVTGGKHLD